MRFRVWLWNPRNVACSVTAATDYYADLCQLHVLKWN